MRILIRMPNWLGDCVMASATLEILKDSFKDASFTLLGAPSSLIYKRDVRIEEIIIDDTKSRNIFTRLKNSVALGRRLGKFDLAISLTNSFFSAFILFISGSKVRLGYKNAFREIFLTRSLRRNDGHNPLHQVERYARLSKEACLIFNKTYMETPALKLTSKPKKICIDCLCIGINPGAAYGSAKRWEENYFIECICYFLEQGFRVYLFGGGGDNFNSELKTSQRMLDVIKHLDVDTKNLINLTGRTNFFDLIDYISALDIFISNDSGPMHVAAALNIPIIAIFGPTPVEVAYPWKCEHILLNKHLSCSPCKKRICPLGHHNCMKLITPDELISATLSLLKRRSLI